MKIIKEGSPKKASQTIEFICPKCDCIFEADNTEYKRETYQRDACTLIAVECPFCKKSFTIDEEKIKRL